MRFQYRASIRLGPAEGPPPTNKAAASACIGSALEKDADRAQAVRAWNQDNRVTQSGRTITTMIEKSESRTLSAIRQEHADSNDDAVQWTTENRLDQRSVSGLRFSCADSYRATDGRALPIRHAPTRPGIVECVVGRWTAHRAHPLLSRSEVLKDRETDTGDGCETPDSVPPPQPEPNAERDAIEAVADCFSDRLVSVLTGKSIVEENPYECAKTYSSPSMFGNRLLASSCAARRAPVLAKELRQRSGSYKGSRSKVAITKYRDWSHAQYQGRKYPLPKHVGAGVLRTHGTRFILPLIGSPSSLAW